MARIPRSAFAPEAGCFHIINRGNNGMNLFQDELDFRHYLNLLQHYKRRFNMKLYAYCLMSNHVHLLVETKKLKDLYKAMHGINLAYTHHYKRRYLWNGHLWQDRYKSYVIEKSKYLITCISYIESNPVKAGIVSDPERYSWCSFKERQEGGVGLLDPLGTD